MTSLHRRQTDISIGAQMPKNTADRACEANTQRKIMNECGRQAATCSRRPKGFYLKRRALRGLEIILLAHPLRATPPGKIAKDSASRTMGNTSPGTGQVLTQV